MKPLHGKWGKWVLRGLIVALLGGMLAWTLRNVPLADIGTTLRNLQLWQILVILAVNLMLYLLVTFRWWIIVQAEAKQVHFLPLVAVRVTAFSLSYFTLGPQVGGEPLQVLALQKKYDLSFTRATASVLLDKMLEFLVNFVLLAIGLAALFQSGLLVENRLVVSLGILLLFGLILVPSVHLFLLYHRHYPLTWLLHHFPHLSRRAKPVRFLCAAEWLAGNFCQRHPRALLGGLAASLLAAAGMLLDYALMISFLGINLPFWKMTAGWTAGWLAFLFPLPGGLGALEIEPGVRPGIARHSGCAGVKPGTGHAGARSIDRWGWIAPGRIWRIGLEK